MSTLPDVVKKALEQREGPAVFTTVSADGVPNSVYVGFVHLDGEDRLVLADNYFHKTRQNILSGSSGSLLFITKKDEAFQLKASIDYETSGEAYDTMKGDWLPAKYPGHAAVVLNVEAVFKGSEQLL